MKILGCVKDEKLFYREIRYEEKNKMGGKMPPTV
jgi:hypothetical protein